MRKPTISETPYGIMLDLRKQGLDAAAFLAKNHGSILGLDGIKYIQSTVRPTAVNPFVEIYNKAAELEKLTNFTMFDLSRCEDIPTVLTLNAVTIDGKYISKSMPQAFKNAWINLTPILGRNDAYNGSSLQLTDVLNFSSLVSRGLLCMSYNDADAWLTPTLNVMIIDIYSLLISSLLRDRFNLDVEEMLLVRTLFAAYMAQLLDGEGSPLDVPPLLNRCKFLYPGGTPRSIYERLEKISDVRHSVAPSGELSIAAISRILASGAGPGRMKMFTDRTFYGYMSHSPGDNQIMSFAMDYPPYFVWELLWNLAGGKNPLFQKLYKYPETKRSVRQFVNELVMSQLFIDRISR